MKISNLTDKLSYFDRVQSKEDRDAELPNKKREQNEKKEEEEKPKSYEMIEKEVTEAIDHFQEDEAMKDLGFQADMMGKGPGLRVFLKDGKGAVIRQLTGEEFLKLRSTPESSPNKKSGKILDQKA